MPAVFTIGYEQHTPASLVETLGEAGVGRVVDVRELPLSRRAGFSKTALEATLGGAGIAYQHVRALGNPKPFRDLWRSGRRTEAEEGYRHHLDGPGAEALPALAASLEATPTCLLCLEASHLDCHRELVVEALARRDPGLDVVHLP